MMRQRWQGSLRAWLCVLKWFDAWGVDFIRLRFIERFNDPFPFSRKLEV